MNSNRLYLRVGATCALLGFIGLFDCDNATAQLTAYSTGFEVADGIVATDNAALGDDGWVVFGTVYPKDGATYLNAITDPNDVIFSYGTFPAPNGPNAAFSLIKTSAPGGEGTPPEGTQEMVVLSDYENAAAHANAANRLETIVFREQSIAPGDVGKTAKFTFLAHSDTVGADILTTDSKANAFIKTINPGAGFSTSSKYSLETTNLDGDPNVFIQMTLSLPITSDLVGQFLQFGFDTWASDYEASGVAYDAVDFSVNDSFGSFFSDFEDKTGTVAANPEALNNAGWRVFGAVFADTDPVNPKFTYGPEPAPNGGSSFSALAPSGGGAEQGAQSLNVFSDYECCGPGTTNEGHFNGTDIVASSVFQEFLVGSDDPNRQMSFSFDAKLPSTLGLGAGASAEFYVQTIDPNTGFLTGTPSVIDASTLGLNTSTWVDGEVLFDILPSMVGDLIQFGVTTRSSDFDPTGILLDNVSFTDSTGLKGDFNGDGTVDGLDFLEWQRNPAVGVLADWEMNYGATSIAAAVSSVPEPTTGLLCLISASLLSTVRRRSV